MTKTLVTVNLEAEEVLEYQKNVGKGKVSSSIRDYIKSVNEEERKKEEAPNLSIISELPSKSSNKLYSIPIFNSSTELSDWLNSINCDSLKWLISYAEELKHLALVVRSGSLWGSVHTDKVPAFPLIEC